MRGSRYKPTEADRNTVKSMAACGFSEESIARSLGVDGIDAKTLRKHFRQELDTSVDKANAAVGNMLFKMATSGENTAATIFWMKTRMRWRETQDLRFVDEAGKDRGMMDLSRMREAMTAALDGQPEETRFSVAKRLLEMSRDDGSKRSQELVKLALAADPALIMESAGMTPDPWQAKVLRTRPRQLLLNCGRQSGKSSTVAAGAIDEALFCPESLTLVMSPSLRQSQELFRVVMGVHRKIGIEIDPEAESSLRAEFPNGSRIIALPGSKEANIRGFASVSLLIVDEAARVPDDLYRAVRPMLAVSGGRIWILSTPFGKRGFFFREWTEGDGWNRVKITAEQCSRIPRDFLEQERRSMPEAWFRQEYFCEFADTDGAVFSYDDVMAALTDEVKPLFDEDEAPRHARPSVATPDVEPLFL